jgi:DUF1009 family protein
MGRLGLIAGNGSFPTLVLEEALRQGIEVVVAAISEEASPEIGQIVEASEGVASVHWLGVGQLGKLIKIFKNSGVDRAVMAGQVKHVQIFAAGGRTPAGRLAALPDLRMLRLLASLEHRNTASLINGIIQVLQKEGVEFMDSTLLLGSLVPKQGVLTQRSPNRAEKRDLAYGRRVATELTRLDLGQTVVVKDGAVVAVEAMEGTDETIRRAAQLVSGQPLRVVKASRPSQDMRFDVPVIGLRTLKTIEECNVSAISIDSGKTLIMDRPNFVRGADRLGIAVVAE